MPMQRTLVAMSLLLLFSLPAAAGDYELVIMDAHGRKCGHSENLEPCQTGITRPACTSREVANDLERYLRGDSPTIAILVGAFTNGHTRFCSARARTGVAAALKRLRLSGKNVRGKQLEDFVVV